MGRPRGHHVTQGILGDPDDRFGFPTLVDEFCSNQAVRGYSFEYVRVDRGHLAKFATWLSADGVTHPADVTTQMLENYQRHLYEYRKLDGTPLTSTSQGAAVGPLKRFYLWGVFAHKLAIDPTIGLTLPRREQRLPKAVLTFREAERVMEQPDLTTVRGLRDRAILETLYSIGIRRGELARLNLDDIDRGRRAVNIRQAKGRKDRIIPIGARALDWIERYLTESRPLLANDDAEALFLSRDGGRITPHRLTQIVVGYVDASGIFKHGGCHLFRHTLATLMLDSGADIRYVQAMLGHASLTSTQIYTHVSITALQKAHAATFARAAAEGRSSAHRRTLSSKRLAAAHRRALHAAGSAQANQGTRRHLSCVAAVRPHSPLRASRACPFQDV